MKLILQKIKRRKHFVFYCLLTQFSFVALAQSPVITIDPTRVTTYAGSTAGFFNATGINAQFDLNTGIAADTFGNVFVADYNNNVIRKISSGGVVTTFAGTGVFGFANGAGTVALFRSPTGVVADLAGNVYVADQFNSMIRKITPAGIVSTLAGDGINGYVDGAGNTARFNAPTGVAADLLGNIYVADQYNHVIRKITPGGVVSTLAGNGTAGYNDATGVLAQFNLPTGVAADALGNVYVADLNNHRIRKINPAGVVTTLAGSGSAAYLDGSGTTAMFNSPSGVFADELQNVYVADKNNQRIRKISPLGLVSTIAGSGSWGLGDGMGIDVQFGNPYSLSKDLAGNIYIGDASNNRVRKISTLVLDAFSTPQGTASAAQNFSVSGRNLTNNVIVTAPAGYEVSLTLAGTYSGSLNISPVSGEVAKIIFIRLSASTMGGIYPGNIIISSTGASSQNLAVNGTVIGTPTSIFTYTNNSCLNRNVVFTDQSILATIYLWNFGDGDTSTLQNPTHLYSKDSSYLVTLTINGNIVSTKTVIVATSPVVGSITASSNCSNLYTFSGAPSGYGYAYAWIFAGGTGSDTTLQNPTRSYTVSGSTSVNLNVTSGGRCQVSASPYIFTPALSTAGVSAAFSITAPGGDLCATSRIITNQSTGGGPSSTYSLDGGSFLTITSPQTLSSLSNGIHNIALATNNGTCFDTARTSFYISMPVVAFNATPNTCNQVVVFSNGTTSTDNGPISYQWYFGSPVQDSSTAINPTYNFISPTPSTASLTAISSSGCSIILVQAVIVGIGNGPTAAYSSALMGGTCQNKIQFTNNTTPSAGNTYTWNFGDGSSSAQTNPARGYGGSGLFTVTLTAVNGACSSSVASQVFIAPTAFGPSAKFTINNPVQIITGNSFDFSNTSSHLGGGYINKYYWNFGDGTIDSTNTFVFGKSYASAGTYNVSLTAVSGIGCTDIYTQSVTVNSVPASNFSYTNNSCSNRTVTFTDLSTAASSYLWSFGDGSTSTLANPSHLYATDSTYLVTLTINGSYLSSQTITVATSPVVGSISSVSNCNNLYTFSGAPTGYGYAYGWTFEGGTGSDTTLLNPTRLYSTGGSTKVDLVVTSGGRCPVNAVQYVFTPNLASSGVTAGVTITAPFNDLCSTSRIITNTSNAGLSSYTVSVDGSAFTVISTPQTLNALAPGLHTVKLATHNGICFDTASVNFYISLPTAGFKSDSNSCDQIVNFTNTSASTDNGFISYQWYFGSVVFDSSTATHPSVNYMSGGTNSATLFATSSSGCIASLTKPVYVGHGSGGPVANFSYAPAMSGICNNKIQFTNLSTGTGLSYLWNFGDGTSSIQSNPIRGYGDTGIFAVSLTVTDGVCSNIKNATVHIASAAFGPSANFTINNPVQIINGNSFNFINISKHLNAGWVNKTYWTFGDGTVDSTRNSIYGKTYASPGTYTVSLGIQTAAGCADYYYQNITVNAVPVSLFTYTNNSCLDRNVVFNNQSILATSYLWNFGDGSTSTLLNPSHLYGRDSTYTVTLTINGNLASNQTIIVATSPAAGSINAIPDCNNVYTFSGAPAGYGYAYLWTFETGTGSDTTLINPTRSYTNGGITKVDLRITSGGRCPVNATQYSFTPNLISAGVTAGVSVTAPLGDLCSNSRIITNTSNAGLPSYTFSIDGGTFSTITIPQTLSSLIPGLHQVKLATNNGVCFDTATSSFYISTPSPSFTATPTTCNQEVSFTNTSTTSDNGSISYIWTFGSPVKGTSTSMNPRFNYGGSGGPDTATLTATSSSGCVSRAFSNGLIVGSGTSGPVAGFTSNIINGICDNQVQFANTTTGLPGTTYYWDFGDGSSSTLTNPRRGYGDTGMFYVSLTATNSGCSSTFSSYIRVADTLAGPSATFTVSNPIQLYTNNSFNFINVSKHLNAGWIYKFYWSFGDGTIDSTHNSYYNKNYTLPGTYVVTLSAVSISGCVDIYQKTVVINPVLTSKFGYTENTCADRTVIFKDSSILATTYLWDFGDLTTSTGANPTHVYLRDSVYTVTLTVNGTAASSKVITVSSNPPVGSISQTADCSFNYTFSGAPAGYSYAYNWTFEHGTGSDTTLLNPTRVYSSSISTRVNLLVTSFGKCPVNATQYTFTPSIVTAGVHASFTITAPSGNLCSTSRIISNTSTPGLSSYTCSIDGAGFSNITFTPLTIPGFSAGLHTIRLAVNNGICYDTSTSNFYISAPTASFTASPSICNQEVTFNNTSTSTDNGTINYLWVFGSPAKGTSTLKNPRFNYGGTGGPDTAILTVTSSSGCVSVVSSSGLIVGSGTSGPYAGFTYNFVSGVCENRVQFTNTSTGTPGLTYLWNFGDGTTSTLANPQRGFGDTGLFNITLIATSGTCQSYASAQIYIADSVFGPSASFTINNPTQFITNNSFNFTNSSKHLNAGWINKFYWSFGDGTVDSTNNSIYNKTYLIPGTYTVSLSALSTAGCTDYYQQTINVNQVVSSKFGYTENSCLNRTVVFTDSSTLATSWLWDFGDGATITTQNPSHLYLKDSTYTVSLTINGTLTSIKTVVVATAPVVGNITSIVDCKNVYTFSGAPTGYGYAYRWTFESGSGSDSTLLNPTRSYTVAGSTRVDLAVTSAGRCQIAAPQYIFTPNLISAGATAGVLIVVPLNDSCSTSRIINNTSNLGLSSYTRSLDGGAFIPISTPQTITSLTPGYHTVRLAAGGGSCFDTATTGFYISAPTASFTSAPTTCNQVVNFTNTSTSSDFGPMTYSWIFGSPLKGTSTSTNPFCDYQLPARTDIAFLTVRSSSGCTSTTSNSVTVGSGTGGPVAGFTASFVSGVCNNQIQFINTSTGSPGLTYYWDFGDGSNSTLANPKRGYGDTGIFNVTLTAISSTCSNMASLQVHIADTMFGPSATFTINNPSQTFPNQSFNFSNTSKHLNAGWINKFYWSFGDGSPIDSTHNSPYNKVYALPGTYVVTLSALSTAGCADFYQQTINVVAVVNSKFGYTENSCLNRSVVFKDSSMLATSWLWNFGDDSTSTAQNPTHVYLKDSTYIVTLTINGTTASTKTITVATTPLLGSISQTSDCAFTYTFSGAPAGYGYQYAWNFNNAGTGSDTSIQLPTRRYSVSAPVTVNLNMNSFGRCAVSASPYNFTPSVAITGVDAGFTITAPSGNLCSTSRIINNTSTTGLSSYTYNIDGGAYTSIAFTPITLSGLSAGLHKINLAVNNGICFDTATNSFYISVPVASFNSTPTTCNQVVNFTNTSVSSDNGPMTYLWSFGSLPVKPTSTFANPIFNYGGTGGMDSAFLAVTSSSGCVVATASTVTVGSGTGGPVAGFTSSQGAGVCKNQIQFINTTTGGTGITYLWNFGDGTSSASVNPVRGYGDTGTFFVTLTATNAVCSTSVIKPVYISDTVSGPSSNFNVNNPTQIITGNSFNFINASKHLNAGWINKYYWTFGDGTVDSTHNSIFGKTYQLGGTYTVTLTLLTIAGCSDTYSKTVTVVPVVISKFGYIENTCSNRDVVFKDSSSMATSWLWDFGDGTTSTSQNPTHTYIKDSTFTVVLTVNGTVVSYQTIIVSTTPVIGTITATPNCANVYTFGGAPANPGYTYSWSFIGGSANNTNGLNPTCSYNVSGSATVNLVVTSYSKCPASALPYVFSPLLTSQGVIAGVTVTPPLGDFCSATRTINNTSNTGLPSYTFSIDGLMYTNIGSSQNIPGLSPGIHFVKLATNNGTCADTATTSFYISTPTPAFTSTPSSCNQVIAFNNLSTSTDNGALTYNWEFGSPVLDSSKDANPFYNFPSAGSYSVKLTATSSSGCKASITNSATASAGTGTISANFTTANAPGICQNKIQFTNTTTGGTGLSYIWNFGDGSTSTQTNPIKSFGDTGTFIVTLTASNGTCQSLVSYPVYMSVFVYGPAANFTINQPSQLFTGNSFNFMNTSKNLNSGWIAKSVWNFGDGKKDSTHAYVYAKTYSAAGTYNVSLVIVSSAGCVDSVVKQVVVIPVPLSDFSFSGNTCSSRTVNFTDLSTLATSYYWDFGDGTSSVLANPVHTYSKDSIYQVSLTINGTLVNTKTVLISNTPNANFNYTANTCQNVFDFNAVQQGDGIGYIWEFSGGTPNDTSIANPRLTFNATTSTTVKLTVSSYGACQANSQTTINSLKGFKAGGTLTATNYCGNSRLLTDTSTGGTVHLYSLDGSGYASYATPVNLTSLSAGYHTLVLTANDGVCYDTLNTVFNISSLSGNFNSTPSVCDKSVSFTNTVVSSDNSPVTYFWNFAGEGTSTNANPTFLFSNTSSKSITLTATGASGCVLTANNNVTPGSTVGPTATFIANEVKSNPCNTGINFVSTSSNAVKYIWDFGDGFVTTESTESFAFHSYDSIKSYYAVLTTINAVGCRTNSAPQLINVTAKGNPSPITRFSNTTDSVQCLSTNSFNFNNTTVLNGNGWIAGYSWSFGDGTFDSLNTFIFGKKYSAINKYNVILTSTTNLGCKSSFTVSVTVKKDTIGCGPATAVENHSDDISANINLFPNPNGGTFSLRLKNIESKSATILIIDMLGREVYATRTSLLNQSEIELNDLNIAAGKYYLILTTEENQIARKPFAVLK
ncbi:MAG: PKD domain-containing protein [Bacteroidota bacterium]|nr:PKD domain-containing protein [Bacteroidota bacterium]